MQLNNCKLGTFRALRAATLTSALVACWLVAGAADQQPDRADNVIADRLHLTRFTVQDLAIDVKDSAKEVTTQMVVGGVERRVIMHPYSLRSSEMMVLEQLADGSMRRVAPPPPRTYRGAVEGELNSVVAASLNADGSLTGAVRIGSEVWGVQPMREVADGADADVPAAQHVVYCQTDVVLPQGVCGVIDRNDIRRAGNQGAEGGIAGSGLSGGVQADIGFDADVEFYQLNGSSVSNTVADIETVMNVVEALYLQEVGIAFRITGTIVRTAEPDPYSATNASALAHEFADHWNSTQPFVRDLAELMTGKSLDGGFIGWALEPMCTNPESAYNVVKSRWSFNLLARAVISGHEIGHNFNAPHCNGQPDCGMMCSNMGNCGGDIFGFGGGTGPTIIGWRDFQCASDLSILGACCTGTLTCTQVSAEECANAGGTWLADVPCTTRTTYSASPNFAIPDGSAVGITHTINVPESFLISDLNVRLNIPHTWIGDLIVDLQHNGGPFVRIVDRMGAPTTQFGCDANDLVVWLDDEAVAGSIENVCSPFFPQSGSPGNAASSGPAFVPNALLSNFNGQNAQGMWTLRVFDVATPDSGTLESWTLDIEDSTGNLCVASDCPADIAPAGGDGAVDVDDLLAVIIGWGPCPASPATCPANIVNGGASANRVDVDDLLAVITHWGACP